jgi:histidinol-phosphatase (PHP family)
MDDYINEVKRLRAKYHKQIKILVGFEAEYHRSQFNFYKKLRDKVDYMILGNHNLGNPHLAKDIKSIKLLDLEQYGRQLKDACESGLFSAIAHPDYVYHYYHS